MNLRRCLCYLLVCAVTCSAVFSISASAASYDKIDITSLIEDVVYQGEDVIVTYDFPIDEFSSIWLRETATGSYTKNYFGSSVLFINEGGGSSTVSSNFLNLMVNNTSKGMTTSASFSVEIPDSIINLNLVKVDGVAYPASATKSTASTNEQVIYSISVVGTTGLICSITLYDNLSSKDSISLTPNITGSSHSLEFFGSEVINTSLYEYMFFNNYPLGSPDDGVSFNVIDISDIRSGYNFSLDFSAFYYFEHDGALYSPFKYQVYFLDKYYNQVGISQGSISETILDEIAPYSVSFTVPDGAKYFYINLFTDEIDVKQCNFLEFYFDQIKMTVAMSAIEAESKTMKAIQEQLKQQLDEEIKQTGFLEKIWNGITELPSKIVNGIKEAIQDLFVPDAEAIAGQKDKWEGLLADRFGAVYEAGTIAEDFAAAFVPGETQEIVNFPATTFDLGEVDFTFGGWEVDVVPEGFEGIIDTLKLIINIVCTLAFVNGLKNRFENVLDGDD